jgi:hypothetical protein
MVNDDDDDDDDNSNNDNNNDNIKKKLEQKWTLAWAQNKFLTVDQKEEKYRKSS